MRRSRRARSRAKTFFVTSKLWVDHFTYEKAKQGIDDSLRKLGLDYLDLYLLHQRTATSPAHGARSRRLSRRVRFARLAFLTSRRTS